MVAFVYKSPISRRSLRGRLTPMMKSTLIPKTNPLPSLAVGIPLNILSYTYTTLHYGENVINPEIAAVLFGLGYFTYNYDRFLDSVNPNEVISGRKEKQKDFYIGNLEFFYASLMVAYGGLTGYFSEFEYLYPFICLINSTLGYKYFKENYGQLKAIYIGLCWCVAVQILPCVIHDQNFDILNYPIDYIPPMLTLFGFSNIADIGDMDEDRANGIMTLPVRFDERLARKISIAAIFIANVMILCNLHFKDNLAWNSLYEIGNMGYIGGELVTDLVLNDNSSMVNITKIRSGKEDIVFLSLIARLLGI